MKIEERPEIVTDEHLEYLDFVRLAGVVNMFGASPLLANAFDLTDEEAGIIHVYWMRSFGERHPQRRGG